MKTKVSLMSLAAGGVLALSAQTFISGELAFDPFALVASPAYAATDSDGEGGGPENSQGNQGGQGAGSKGTQSGQDSQGGGGSGQGGPGADSDSKGPQAGGPSSSGSGGGKPAWAQEGIPEVELGRLSVARSPDQVLDRAYAEAIAMLEAEPAVEDFYELSLEAMIEKLSLEWDETTIIDSPLQNLALMKDILDGTNNTGISNSDETLLAVFLGVASDKAVPISADTVIAVTTILGNPIEGTAAEDLAADAEAIRIAVLAGHG